MYLYIYFFIIYPDKFIIHKKIPPQGEGFPKQ